VTHNHRWQTTGVFALSSLLRHAPAEAHERISALLGHGENICRSSRVPMRWAPSGDGKSTTTIGVFIRRVFRSGDESVLRCASWIFRAVAERDKEFAIELLANANSARCTSVQRRDFMWLDDDKFIPFDSICDEDLERIIQLFATPDRLDDYFMHGFLARVAKRNPRQVLELAKARLERAVAEDNWKYSPIGGPGSATGSLNLLEHPDGAGCSVRPSLGRCRVLRAISSRIASPISSSEYSVRRAGLHFHP